jgi:hypothetical protein
MTESMQEHDVQDATASGPEPSDGYRLREVEARLARRLDALEGQRERLKWMSRLTMAGMVVTLIALAAVLGTATGDRETLSAGTLYAGEVVLRDADRVTRGHLGLDTQGRVQFALSDRDGRERIALTVLGDGSPGVTISDDDAHPRAVLGHLPDGTTSLVFADAEGITRAVVGLGADGSTHALFADRAGLIRTLVGVDADGAPSMSLVEGDDAPAAPEVAEVSDDSADDAAETQADADDDDAAEGT